MERKNTYDFDDFLSETSEGKERIPTILVFNTRSVEGYLSPEGVPTEKPFQDEQGNWGKKYYMLETSAKPLRVLGYSHRVYANVKDGGIEVYVGKELAFSVKAKAEIKSTLGGHTLELTGWEKRSLGYDPIEGETIERIGLLTHVYATDGEKLFVVEIKRGHLPAFGAYTATMSAEAKQVWTAYRRYKSLFREPTKEKIDAFMEALSPFPEILEKAYGCFNDQVAFDRNALKEKVGAELISRARELYDRYLLDFVSENPSALFAQVSDGRRISRSGGMLTGSLGIRDSEVPVALTLGTTIVPMRVPMQEGLGQEGLGPGVMVLNMIGVKGGDCNIYLNGFQKKVLSMARKGGEGKITHGKIDAFLGKYPPESYRAIYDEMKKEGRPPVSAIGSVSLVSGVLTGEELDERILRIAELYGKAFGGEFFPVSEKYLERAADNLHAAVRKATTPDPNAKRENEDYQNEFLDQALREIDEDDDRKKGRGRGQG